MSSYPIEFRKRVKYLENQIHQDMGLDDFGSIVSVPTGGLVIASALAIETVKPLIHVRSQKTMEHQNQWKGKFMMA